VTRTWGYIILGFFLKTFEVAMRLSIFLAEGAKNKEKEDAFLYVLLRKMISSSIPLKNLDTSRCHDTFFVSQAIPATFTSSGGGRR
jgi:hypothetical protein